MSDGVGNSRLRREGGYSHQLMTYRRDIDGLRAVAVLPVVAFHAGIRVFAGGYVGVDVFFVISGYLLGSIVFSEIQASEFSIVRFYERRARRILPALVATVIVSSIAAYFLLLPTEFEAFGSSVVSVIASVSNIYYWLHAGYFDTSSETEPLLHTWSLAVEEQFYLLFPITMVLLAKWRRARLSLSLTVLASASLFASAVGAYRFPQSTFYLVHTRTWEFLLGTLIALDVFPQVGTSTMRNILSCVGLGLISVAVFTFSTDTVFPGLTALVPCVGAGLIIATGRSGGSAVASLLSLQPVRFLGLISYSLYLWHWPIFVLLRICGVLSHLHAPITRLAAIAATIGVAALSWKCIEMPFRVGRGRPTRSTFFRLAGISTAAVGLFGFATVLAHGAPWRYTPQAIAVAAYLKYEDKSLFREGSCFIYGQYDFEDFDQAACLRGIAGRQSYLLIGDSHAAHLWYGLSAAFSGVNILQATAAGCKPTIDQPSTADIQCSRLMHYIYENYLPNNKVNKVLIAGRWEEGDLPSLDITLAALRKRGISAVLIGPIIQYDVALPRLLAISIQRNDSAVLDEHRVDQSALDGRMKELAHAQQTSYISLYDLLCDHKACIEVVEDGIPLQFDKAHLTGAGSVFVAGRIARSDAWSLRAAEYR
jgi:peptidoglycan/LPS O-acetylase OafA/YrhL